MVLTNNSPYTLEKVIALDEQYNRELNVPSSEAIPEHGRGGK